MKAKEVLVIIRGAGDLATGVAIKLHRCGFPVIMLEISKPTVIRTTVAFATAAFTNEQVVEDVKAVLCSKEEALEVAKQGLVAVVNDPKGELIEKLKPQVVVDAIIAKKNLGTKISMAPLVIALGPGFEAQKDAHAVIETMRGSTLGKVIYSGSAIANTSVPGMVGGFTYQRVMHSPCEGIFKSVKKIGDIVSPGDVVALVDTTPVFTEIGGKVRGMLTDGLTVPMHFKVADVDPRGNEVDHTLCSDKARCIADGVLEAIIHHLGSNI